MTWVRFGAASLRPVASDTGPVAKRKLRIGQCIIMTMKLLRLRLVFLALLLPVVVAAGSRETAFQAQAMLGPEVWSRVLRIENERPGSGSLYPAEFFALLVEFEGILWLYSEFDGTQSLSRQVGSTERDRADLGPLLREVEPGLVKFEEVTGPPTKGLRAGPPPQHCFLSSVARWEELRRGTNPPTRARLLAFYDEGGRRGHMVLEYWQKGRRFIFDCEYPAGERELSRRLSDDPLRVARVLYRKDPRRNPARAAHLKLEGA